MFPSPDLRKAAREVAGSAFVRQSAILFCASLAVNVLGYAFHFAISRRLGVAAYGVLSALNAAYMIALAVAGIATTVVVKYAAELHVDPTAAERLSAFAYRLLRWCAITAAVAILAGVLALRPISAFLQINDPGAVLLTSAIVGLVLACTPLRALFLGTEAFGTYALLTVSEAVGKALFGVLLVYAGFGVTGAFGGWLTGTVLSAGFTASMIFRGFPRHRRVAVGLDVRRVALTTANVGAATVLLGIIGYVDVLLVKHYADARTAGLYGALALSGKVLLFLVSFVPTIVLPKATRLALRGQPARPLLLQAASITVLMSAAALCVYAAAPRAIVTTLAGPAFAGAAPYVLRYGVAMMLLAMLNVVVMYKLGIHRFDFIGPLAIVAAGEIAGIALYHRSIADVITVLIVVNAVALVASLVGVNLRFGLRFDERDVKGASGGTVICPP